MLLSGLLAGLRGSLDSMECEVSHGVFFHLGLIDPELGLMFDFRLIGPVFSITLDHVRSRAREYRPSDDKVLGVDA